MNLTSLDFDCPNSQTLGAHAKPFLPYRISQLLLGWSNKFALTRSDATCSGKLASQIESWVDIVKDMILMARKTTDDVLAREVVVSIQRNG